MLVRASSYFRSSMPPLSSSDGMSSSAASTRASARSRSAPDSSRIPMKSARTSSALPTVVAATRWSSRSVHGPDQCGASRLRPVFTDASTRGLAAASHPSFRNSSPGPSPTLSAVLAFSGVAPRLAPQRPVGSPRTTAAFEPLALVAVTE